MKLYTNYSTIPRSYYHCCSRQNLLFRLPANHMPTNWLEQRRDRIPITAKVLFLWQWTAPICCNDGWKLIYAGSRFTTETESWYAPTEGEALAIAWSLFVLRCNDLIVIIAHYWESSTIAILVLWPTPVFKNLKDGHSDSNSPFSIALGNGFMVLMQCQETHQQ